MTDRACSSVELKDEMFTERWCLATASIDDGALRVSREIDGSTYTTLYAAGHWLLIRFHPDCCDPEREDRDD